MARADVLAVAEALADLEDRPEPGREELLHRVLRRGCEKAPAPLAARVRPTGLEYLQVRLHPRESNQQRRLDLAKPAAFEEGANRVHDRLAHQARGGRSLPGADALPG